MYKQLSVLLLMLISLACLSKEKSISKKRKNEYALLLNNSYNLNKIDFTTNVPYTTCKNTLSQSIEIKYIRTIGRRFIFLTGVELGQDQYKFVLNAPYDQNNPYDVNKGRIGNIVQAIPYVKLNLGVGLRFRELGRYTPEIQLTQVAQRSFGYHDLYAEKYVIPSEFYYGRIGYLANGHDGDKGIELLNTLYFGVKYKIEKSFISMVNVGIRLQRKFIMAKGQSSFNYFRTEYTDNTGSLLGRDSFSGRHHAVTLVLGVTF